MTHFHHYVIRERGIGICKWTQCPERVKQHSSWEWLTPTDNGLTWNSQGWAHRQLPRIEDSYE